MKVHIGIKRNINPRKLKKSSHSVQARLITWRKRTEVTLIQRGNTFLKNYDPEMADVMKQAITEQGINLVIGATFEHVEQHGDIKQR